MIVRENRTNLRGFFSDIGWSYTKTTGLVFLLLIHPTLTQQIFQMFNCTDFAGNKFLSVDLYAISSNVGLFLIFVDRSISCDDNKYKAWASGAVAMIFFYVIGIPAVAFYQLFTHRHQLQDPIVRSRLKFLYDGYSLYLCPQC